MPSGDVYVCPEEVSVYVLTCQLDMGTSLVWAVQLANVGSGSAELIILHVPQSTSDPMIGESSTLTSGVEATLVSVSPVSSNLTVNTARLNNPRTAFPIEIRCWDTSMPQLQMVSRIIQVGKSPEIVGHCICL